MMYCTNCNTENENNAHECINCGAVLFEGKSEAETAKETTPVQVKIEKNYSSTKPIVSIIMAFLNFNILGLIFSIKSLSNYNKYEKALLALDFEAAEAYGKSSKKLSRAAIIITVILLVIRPIFLSVFVLKGATTLGLIGDNSIMEAGMISMLSIMW